MESHYLSERLLVILSPVNKEQQNQLMSSAGYENVSWRLIAIVNMFLLPKDSLYSSFEIIVGIVSTEVLFGIVPTVCKS
jgi:hypothetical protein